MSRRNSSPLAPLFHQKLDRIPLDTDLQVSKGELAHRKANGEFGRRRPVRNDLRDGNVTIHDHDAFAGPDRSQFLTDVCLELRDVCGLHMTILGHLV